MKLTPRDRVIKAVAHEEPDRVPLGGSFRGEHWQELHKHFKTRSVDVVLDRLGIDFRGIDMNASEAFRQKAVYHPGSPGRPFHTLPDGLLEDEWGIRYKPLRGMVENRVYFPLQHVKSLEEYEFPDINAPGRFDKTEKLTKKYREKYALIAGLGWTLFEQAWHLRGFESLIRDLYSNQKFADDLLDKLLEFRLEEGKKLLEFDPDIIGIGDDVGGQRGMLISPLIWRRYLKPRMRTLITELKKKRHVYVSYHSDGYIEPIIPDLIEVGVDILNPVQPECMDFEGIKREYGEKLTLSGTISCQKTLPFGTRQDVKNEVITRIKTLGCGGGLILAPACPRPGPEVPLENILTLYETAKKYNYRYLKDWKA
jgi:uroporphyrinogen decarboxylase